jgi:hypothetical protein
VKGAHVIAFVVVVNPVLHVMQMRSAVAVPFVCTNSPGMQTVYGVHVLSVLLVPATEMKPVVPHDVQDAHAVALAAALNVPVAQGEHCRSAVVDPGAVGEMKLPAVQLLHGAQALAGLMSLSHDPVAQGPPAFVPPGQYQPTAQFAHVAGLVLVAGAV